jgi:AraC-like DNA-binding protein
MNEREWADSPPGCDGVELLHARFERHVYDRHIHDTYAIGVTLHGVQRFWCRGSYHDSTPGQVMVIRPGEVHDGRSGAAGGYVYRMFYVREDVLLAAVDDTRPGTRDLTVSGPLVSNPAVFNLLNAGWTAMALSPSSLASDELLLRSLSALATNAGKPSRKPIIRNDQVLARVRDYLHERVECSVTMSELSALSSLSRFQLTRQFQRRYGLPIHAYLRHLRLEEARRRLARGHDIAIVAADLGFVDQSHFHHRFRGSYGMTPGQWRAAHGYKTTRMRATYRDAHATDGRTRRRSETL